MKPIYVESVSVYGKGLLGWEHTKTVFQDLSLYDATQMPKIESTYLTPNNARRTTHHMHVAFQAADMALQTSDVDKESVEFVFATSECDLDIAEDNCIALISDEKSVSPQKFQNVVLNAAAGHLGVFMKNTSGSTTISGHHNNFSAALLQAYSSLQANPNPVLLVAYDAPCKMPYGPGDRPFFGLGMVLTQSKTAKSIMAVTPSLVPEPNPQTIAHDDLEAIRSSTPAAGCLPMLMALAKKETSSVELYYSPELGLKVSLCTP
jgi:hypothetical protein